MTLRPASIPKKAPRAWHRTTTMHLGREESRHDRNGKERGRAGARQDERQAASPDHAPGDEQPPGEIPPRPEGDEPDGSRDPGRGHEPRSSSTGLRVPVGSGRLPLADAPFEPRHGDRDQRREVAAEEDVLAERRAHGQARHGGIPRLGQRVPPERLSESEDTDRRASEQRRVDEGPDGARRPALRRGPGGRAGSPSRTSGARGRGRSCPGGFATGRAT